MTDCLLSYTPKGRLDLKSLKDPDQMAQTFEGMPLGCSLWSMLLGVLAITMFTFGYLGISRWMEQFSQTYATILYIAGIVCIVPMVAHHVFCGTVEWFYVRLGRTAEARKAVLDFLKQTDVTMVLSYLGFAAFAITLFVAVVTGQTILPAWACVFNALPAMIVLAPTKLPAKANIAGAVMFLGLLILI